MSTMQTPTFNTTLNNSIPLFPSNVSLQITSSVNCADLRDHLENSNRQFADFEMYIIVLYSLVIVLGVCANVLVLAAVCHSPELRIALNACIVQLAISDICMCLFTAPSTVYIYLRNYWPYGRVLCRGISSTQALNTFVSSFTLVAIGYCRWSSLSPSRRGSNTMLKCCFIAVWLVSVCLASPYYFAMEIAPITQNAEHASWILNCGMPMPYTCNEQWDSISFLSSEVYTSCVFALQYAAPVLALIGSYLGIAHVMHTRRQKLFRMNTTGANKRNEQKNTNNLKTRTHRSFILMGSLVLCYAICWLPTNLCHFLMLTGWIQRSDIRISLACLFIAILQVVINPILYGLFNENFRRVYWLMARECFTCKRIHNENRDFYTTKKSDTQKEKDALLKRKTENGTSKTKSQEETDAAMEMEVINV